MKTDLALIVSKLREGNKRLMEYEFNGQAYVTIYNEYHKWISDLADFIEDEIKENASHQQVNTGGSDE